LRGTPQIYSGDELGMAGGKDPDNRHDFPGGFAGDAHDAFTRAGRTANEQEVFAWTSGLLALRESHPAFQTGLEQNLFADEDGFAFVRAPNAAGCSADHSTERFLVIANKAQQSRQIQLTAEGTALEGCTDFRAVHPTAGTGSIARTTKLQIDEPAVSMTVFAVR